MDKPKFETFISVILSQGFDQFVTLYYPPLFRGETDLQIALAQWQAWRTDDGYKKIVRWRSERARSVRNWIWEILLRAKGPDARYVLASEERSDLSCLSHVLFGGCSLDVREWYARWREISKGSAYDRVLDERTGGLLKYFVMKVGCPMELWTPVCDGTLDRNDFWRRQGDGDRDHPTKHLYRWIGKAGLNRVTNFIDGRDPTPSTSDLIAIIGKRESK